MNRKFITAAAILSVISVSLIGSDILAEGQHRSTANGSGNGYHRNLSTESDGTIRGRDIADKGTLTTLSGVLEEKDTEWYLKSGSSTYALHIGNTDYRDKSGINLASGKSASVKGFTTGTDVAVATITMDNQEYKFRSDDGRPMWAGQGKGRNRSNH